MKVDRVKIDWTYTGKPNVLSGTGATSSEKILMWGAGILFTVILVLAQLLREEIVWNWWQWGLFSIIAFDIAGGVTANSLNSCKRMYLSPLNDADTGSIRQMKNHWLFFSLHVHTIIVEALFPTGNLAVGITWYMLFLLSIWVTLSVPLYLRRPIAFTIIVLAVCVSFYFLPSAAGFEWLIPFLFLKNVYGHSVREEPYRPV